MKLYTVVVHYLQMCMKEYGCCPKFKRGDNSTYTFTKRGGGGRVPCKLLLNGLLEFCETLHSCSTLPADMHEGIWCCSKFKMGDNSTYTFTKRGGGMYLVSATPTKLLIEFL